MHMSASQSKQGRIQGNTVADGWAGAVVRKPLGIQKCDVPTFRPTDTASSGVACLRLKMVKNTILIFDYSWLALGPPVLATSYSIVWYTYVSSAISYASQSVATKSKSRVSKLPPKFILIPIHFRNALNYEKQLIETCGLYRPKWPKWLNKAK